MRRFLIPAVLLAVTLGTPTVSLAQLPPRDTSAEAKKGTAIIRGRIVAADTGSPVRGATVSLRSSELKEPRTATTDGEGRYEIKDLPAGRFMLGVSPGRHRAMYLGTTGVASGKDRGPRIVEVADGQILKDIDFTLIRALAIEGLVVDEHGEPLSNVRVSLVAARAGGTATFSGTSTSDLGGFRLFGLEAGEYYIKAEAGQVGTVAVGPASPQLPDEYVPTYYPGTSNLAEAPTVKLERGQDLADLTIRMARGRAYRITGLVLDPEGRPAAANAMIMLATISQGSLPSLGGALTKPDGTFELGRVPPGDYALAARLVSDQRQASRPLRVSVVSADIENLTLAIVPGATLAGHVITDNGSVPAFRPSGAALAFATDRSNVVAGPQLTGPIRDDWTFEITGARVPVLLRLPARLAEGWRLKSVYYKDADITNIPTDFTEDVAASDLTMVLTDTGAKLEGLVLDAAGKPMPGIPVLLFTDEPSQRFLQSTRVRTTTSDEQGRYKLEGVPAGSYRILATESSPFQGVVLPDATLFEPLEKLATEVTLGENEPKTINLTVAKLER